MDAVLKFIDKMVAGMSSSTMQIIRLSGLLVWLIIATIIVTIAWSYGSESVPPSGQDLSMQTIREKIQKEKNLKNPPQMDIAGGRNVTVPGIGELRKDDPTGRSFYPARKKGNELAGDGKKTYPGYVNQKPGTAGEPARSHEPVLPRDDDNRSRTGTRPSQSPFPARGPGRVPARGTESPGRTQTPPGVNPAERKTPAVKPEQRDEKKTRSKPGTAPVYRTEKRGRTAEPAFKE